MLKFRAVLVLFFTLMLNNSYAESWLNNEVFQQNVEFARGEVNAIADGGRESFAVSVAEAVSPSKRRPCGCHYLFCHQNVPQPCQRYCERGGCGQ